MTDTHRSARAGRGGGGSHPHASPHIHGLQALEWVPHTRALGKDLGVGPAASLVSKGEHFL